MYNQTVIISLEFGCKLMFLMLYSFTDEQLPLTCFLFCECVLITVLKCLSSTCCTD